MNEATRAGLPGLPKLTHNNWEKKNHYTITMNMWYGNNGTTWRLYENERLILTQELTDNSPAAQTAAVQLKEKEIGRYVYRCELINSFGQSASDPITVAVGEANDGNAIRISSLDSVGNSALQLTLDQATTEFSLTLNEPQVPSFSVVTNNPAVVRCSIENGATLRLSGLAQGRASLRIMDSRSGRTRYLGLRVKDSAGHLPGLPDYLAVGSVSEDTAGDLAFWRDFQPGLANKRMDIRYIYLNGGPFKGWRSWTDKDGARAETFIAESLKLGMIPFFVYYNIPDNDEGYAIDCQHIQDDRYMQGYFSDLKFALDIVNRTAGDEIVGFVLEPDFIGYLMQNAATSPQAIRAQTGAAYRCGVLDRSADPTFPDTVDGLIQAINYTIHKHAPNAYFGWQFNLWASNGITTSIPAAGLIHLTDSLGIAAGRAAITAEAKAIARYYLSAGIASHGAAFVSIDKYGYDAGSASPTEPAQSKWFWNADHWNNYLLFAQTLQQESKLPVVLWQLPVGHVNSTLSLNPYDKSGRFADLANTARNYEDSAPTFFFGDSFTATGSRFAHFSANAGNDSQISAAGSTIHWGSHMKEAAAGGICAILFGAGVNDSTDGIGSPPTDDYWWITQAQNYLQKPVAKKALRSEPNTSDE